MFIGVLQAQAALTFVSSSTASSTTSLKFTTASITTTIGNLLSVACVETGGGSDFSVTNVTSSDGIAFTNFALVSSSAYGTVTGWYGIASTTATISISCSYAAAPTDAVQGVMQYSGNATTNVFDASSSKSVATNITSSTDSITTTNANDVITSFGYANSDGALTSVGAPMTQRFLKVGLFGMGGADFTTSSVLTNATFKWTFSSSPWADVIGAFKAAAVVSTGTPTSDVTVINAMTVRDGVTIR